MPTASTAQILGNNESFEPYTQNLYVRRVLSGEFVQVNRHRLRDLIERGLWTEDLRMQPIAHNGSVQQVDVPADMRSSTRRYGKSSSAWCSTWRQTAGRTSTGRHMLVPAQVHQRPFGRAKRC